MASLFWSIWQMMRSLADYITHMARDGTYGDQITLYAAANLYNIDIQIVSSLGLVGSMCSVRQQVFQQLPCTLDILLRTKANNVWAWNKLRITKTVMKKKTKQMTQETENFRELCK